MHGEEAGSLAPAGGEAGIRRGVAGALMFTFVIAVIAVGPSAASAVRLLLTPHPSSLNGVGE